MKYLKYLLAFFVLQLSAQDQLRFINGDKWFGELKQLNNEKIEFKSELSDKALSFKVNNLIRVLFPKNDKSFKEENTIHLTNGDTIVGNLLEMDMEQITIDTTFAGVLQLPRKTIKRLQYNSSKNALQTAETIWPETYSPYKTPLNLQSKLKFERPVVIEANVSGTTTRFSLRFSGRNKNNRPYSLSSTVTKYGTNVRASAQAYDTAISANEKADKALKTVTSNFKLKIYINHQKGLFLFYINNEEVASFDLGSKVDWQNPTMTISTNSNTLLNNLSISKWSGKKPRARQTAQVNSEDVKISFKNGDVAYGQVININDEEVHFKSILGDINIPISTITEVLLPNPDFTTPQKGFTLSRGPLRISGDVTYKNGILHISSSYLSKIKLKKEHFRVLSRYVKPYRAAQLTTINVGEHIIKGKVLTLKDGIFEVENANLIGKPALKSQTLKSIQLYKSSSRRRTKERNWNIELTNGDNFITTRYSLENKNITLHLGTIPLTVPLSQLKSIKPIQPNRNRKSQFMQNLPDRYSVHFKVNVTEGGFKMLKDKNNPYPIFYLNARSNSSSYIYLKYMLELMPMTVSSRQKLTEWEIKSHNKLIYQKHNNFELKIDHAKGRIEIWANKKLINSATDEIKENMPAFNKWNKQNIVALKRIQQPNGGWHLLGGRMESLSTNIALLSLAMNYRILPIYERLESE